MSVFGHLFTFVNSMAVSKYMVWVGSCFQVKSYVTSWFIKSLANFSGHVP